MRHGCAVISEKLLSAPAVGLLACAHPNTAITDIWQHCPLAESTRAASQTDGPPQSHWPLSHSPFSEEIEFLPGADEWNTVELGRE